jgi:prepilin-type N-terminal cleavage/methylation domain-containing protein
MTAKKAFTLIEVMVVVLILGILAVNVITTIQAYATETKETTSKENLRILRGIIQLYSAKNRDVPPGYTDNDPTQPASSIIFVQQVVQDGHYLAKLPKNPFNEFNTVTVLGNGDEFPADAPGDTGWIYKPEIPEVRLNWPGTDGDGVRYYDY